MIPRSSDRPTNSLGHAPRKPPSQLGFPLGRHSEERWRHPRDRRADSSPNNQTHSLPRSSETLYYSYTATPSQILVTSAAQRLSGSAASALGIGHGGGWLKTLLEPEVWPTDQGPGGVSSDCPPATTERLENNVPSAWIWYAWQRTGGGWPGGGLSDKPFSRCRSVSNPCSSLASPRRITRPPMSPSPLSPKDSAH